MAGPFPHPRTVSRTRSWARDLHRAALLLGIGGAVYWFSFGLGRRSLYLPGLGTMYVDLLAAWIAILLQVAAWPSLWDGLRGLRARHPRDANPRIAWRSFLTAVLLALAPLAVLPLQYHAFSSAGASILVLYVTVFPFVPWTFIPLLVLHAILFGRVANYLEPRGRHVADLGALLLFAVAAVTSAVIIEHPDPNAFMRSWSVGRGLLPAAAFAAYALIAVGLTLHVVPSGARARARAAHGAR